MASLTKEEILQAVAAGTMTVEEASKQMPATEKKPAGLYCKVSQKGAVSVYGLQRMPVTIYAEQWHRVLDFGDEIRSFIKEHEPQLQWKNKPQAASPIDLPSKAAIDDKVEVPFTGDLTDDIDLG